MELTHGKDILYFRPKYPIFYVIIKPVSCNNIVHFLMVWFGILHKVDYQYFYNVVLDAIYLCDMLM